MLEVRGLKEGGAVYLDDVQLEEGSVLTLYNSAVAGGTTNSFITTFGDGSILGTTTGTIYPAQDGIGSLGTTSNRWHDLYLSKAAINENGDLNLDGDASVGGDLTVNDSATFKGDVTFGGVTYSFPSSQGAADSVLMNDGAGTLTWGTFGAASVTADSLDFAQFADAMTVDADTSINLYNGGAKSLRFLNSNSGSELLYLDGTTGRVGIGTTSPGTMLDVNGTLSVNGLATFDRGSNNRAVLIGNSFSITPDYTTGTRQDVYLGVNTYVESGLYTAIDTGPGSWVIRPGAFNTDTNSSINFLYRNAGTAINTPPTIVSKIYNTGGIAIGATAASVNGALFPAGGLLISGKVGIGTTNPGAKLEVAGGAKIGYLGSGITAPSNGILVQGNVGIGTTAPGYTLDVSGDINTTGDIRKNGTAYTNPDYVFEPDYNTMSLDELKVFVTDNQHLPGVPSSEDVLRDGVKLFEQTRLNLEKTEEAYLYLFDLNDRLSALSLSLPSITSGPGIPNI